MPEFKISLASYSFNGAIREEKLNIFTYFDLLKYRYHVDYADIWTEGCFKSLDEDYIKSIKASLDQHGLKIANLCVDGPYVYLADPEERAQHKAEMLKYLNAARILEAATVRIDFGFAGDGIRTAFGPNSRNLTREQMYSMDNEAFDYIVNTYKEYCGIVSEWGGRIGPENHWGWDRIPEYLINVAKAVDDPAYGHLYHIGNFYDNKEIGEEYCISNAMHTHVPANTLPFAKDTLRRLALSDYKGCYGVEHHSREFVTERVDWHLGTLRSIIAELKEADLTQPCDGGYAAGVYAGKPMF